MPRRPAAITQADIARVLRAAKQAGAARLRATMTVIGVRMVIPRELYGSPRRIRATPRADARGSTR